MKGNNMDIEAGFTVVRLPAKSAGNTLIIETRPVAVLDDYPGGIDAARRNARKLAGDWAQGVEERYPLDDVFVIETGSDQPLPADRDRPSDTQQRRRMKAGFYVVRRTVPGSGTRLIIESVPFRIRPDIDGDDARERARMMADNWCDFIKGQYPRHQVFVIEREPV